MRVVALSDTHGLHDAVTVPDGDLLVHAGDLTRRGEMKDVAAFDRWLGTLGHRHKVVVAGNHDFCFERRPADARGLLTNGHYLEDEAIEIEGYTIYGSPWQPWFYDWAFNLPRGPALAEKWAAIPADTEILITHGPPFGYLDRTFAGESVGCRALTRRLEELSVRVHVFGHIHEAYGQQTLGQTHLLNASICTLGYEPVNPPVVFEL